MADYFFQDAPKLLADLHAALSANDAEAIGAAHKLKGTVGYLGAEPALKSAAHVEQIGLSGDLTGAAEAIQRLEREIACLSKELSAYRDAV